MFLWGCLSILAIPAILAILAISRSIRVHPRKSAVKFYRNKFFKMKIAFAGRSARRRIR